MTKVLSGAVIPSSGTIRIDGEQQQFTNPADSRRCHIEMVYQDLSLCDTVDVAGNLFMGREPMKSVLGIPFLDEAKMHADAREMLKGLGISIPDTRLLVRNLSGGQRQAIAIARAAAFDPKVLIMDEPTAALAVAEVEAVSGAHSPRFRSRGERDSDYPPPAGPVPGLRPDHGDV
ncbi:ABC transporter [Klebsiella pneumoniae]|uniref:ABC transporter n=1 Tax=Klebsiella pneumoniae TaxID=573 RepID=A0A3S4K8M1_KLEPN|nr:ABC transporter [Klebsiella pneumoniae]